MVADAAADAGARRQRHVPLPRPLQLRVHRRLRRARGGQLLGDALRGIRLYEQRRVDAIALRVTTFTQPRCMKKAECETLPATRMYLPAR